MRPIDKRPTCPFCQDKYGMTRRWVEDYLEDRTYTLQMIASLAGVLAGGWALGYATAMMLGGCS